MRWCPKCHHPAEAGSRFCSRCGEVLPYRRCDSCGTANEVDAWRCVECGASLRPMARANPEPEPADEPSAALGPLARLAELRASSAAQPTRDPPAMSATPPAIAPAPAPAPAAPPKAIPAAARPDFGETAPAILAAEALRAAHAFAPRELEPPTPQALPGLHRPAAPAPTMPPHLAETLQSIARVVADAPAVAPPAVPSTQALPPYSPTVALPPTGGLSALALPWAPASPGAAPAADAVDLYLEVPAPATMQVDIPLGVEPAAGFAPPPYGEAPTATGDAAGGGFARGRPGGLNRPLVAGAVAGLVLAVLVGLILHWQRLNSADGGTAPDRRAVDEADARRGTPAPSATLGRDLPPRPAALPPDGAQRTLPPAGASASAAARRGPGVDAAADAALEAAERLLATRPPPPGAAASAPRPARPGGG